MVLGLGRKAEAQGCPPSVNGREPSVCLASMSMKDAKTAGSAPADGPRVPPLELALHRPEALLHLVPKAGVLFTAGAVAGAIGKTLTAPLDRVKLLLQVQGGYAGVQVTAAAKSGNVFKALYAIGKEEGMMAFWKGNLPQVIRVIPYSAAQLTGYEFFKKAFHTDKEKDLPVSRRLAAGACAGMVSTLLTYPLDSIRLRLAVDPGIKGIGAAARVLVAEGGVGGLYRGIGTAMMGIAPYLAIELAAFDLIPKDQVPSFFRGFSAALLATSVCYPLDTIRRQMQMQTKAAIPLAQLLQTQISEHGVQSLYRGFLPNALKNLPNKGIRLSVFDQAKLLLDKSEKAYEEEQESYKRNQKSHARPLGHITAPLCRIAPPSDNR